MKIVIHRQTLVTLGILLGSLFVLAVVYLMARKRKVKTPKKKPAKKTQGDAKKKRTKKRKVGNKRVMKNLYGEPLKRCQKYPDDARGSWINGYCSETDGGVHQICMDVNRSSQNFAKDTKQGSNWSVDRVGKNHCMCLGAWSLYKERQRRGEIPETTDELQCDAISEVSLSEHYTGKWNTWNGHEKPQQIVTGINTMVGQCYKNKRGRGKEYLKNSYCEFARDKPEFHNTATYREICL